MLRSPAVRALQFTLFDGIKHGISTRHGGVSVGQYTSLNMGLSTGDLEENVLANRARFVGSLGLQMTQVVIGRLSHGNGVTVLHGDRHQDLSARPVRPSSGTTERIFTSDAVVSDVPGLYFLLTFADCVPLFFLDRVRGVVGAAHAGWRGTALGIAQAVVRAMRTEFGSRTEDIVAGIGPAIGPCCYPVGPEVSAAFRSNGFVPVLARTAHDTRLDLAASNERQLRACGMQVDAIETLRLCTSCHVADFYSHRAERGQTGRLAAVIGVR